MSPYEILLEGREIVITIMNRKDMANEHCFSGHQVCGSTTPNEYWQYTDSIQIIKEIFDNKMVPLTLDGLDEATNFRSKLIIIIFKLKNIKLNLMIFQKIAITFYIFFS